MCDKRENKEAVAAAVGEIRLWPTGLGWAGLGASPEAKRCAIRDRGENVGRVKVGTGSWDLPADPTKLGSKRRIQPTRLGMNLGRFENVQKCDPMKDLVIKIAFGNDTRVETG